MRLCFGRPRIHFGILVGFALAMTLAASVSTAKRLPSETGNYRGQCRQLTKQINHFEHTILPLAISRGNRKWERATNEQVARLWNRRADLCAQYGSQRSLIAKTRDRIRKINKMIAMAGRAAMAYFTGGLSGGIVP
jgi:hypothetical protein